MKPEGEERNTAPGPPEAGLGVPTMKAGLALVSVIAVAAAAGSLLGLPVPALDGSSGSSSGLGAADAASLALLDGGTSAGLTEGPYHPVAGEMGYGERAAKFGASRYGRRHEGQDVFAKPGTPLVAVRDGVVVDGGERERLATRAAAATTSSSTASSTTAATSTCTC